MSVNLIKHDTKIKNTRYTTINIIYSVKIVNFDNTIKNEK